MIWHIMNLNGISRRVVSFMIRPLYLQTKIEEMSMKLVAIQEGRIKEAEYKQIEKDKNWQS